ncbi:MAG: energy-coupling factor transporter ATPase [Candidatus Carbobacillus altaicus]|nr:energy-coupling factor transporter ATPase [Candidatus Carbobacillus altaicus]
MEIVFDAISYVYGQGTPFAKQALSRVSFSLPSGSAAAIMGVTGSGKSTIGQLAAGLLFPTEGRVMVDGVEIKRKNPHLTGLRRRIGYAFQFPEHQLFEETVRKEVAFALKGRGLSPEEEEERVIRALRSFGLDESYLARAPLFLSGGEKRRVALASIFVTEPDLLILDEATAGLDPLGREAILTHLAHWYEERKPTVLYITHDLDEALFLTDTLFVMAGGSLIWHGKVSDFFSAYLFESRMRHRFEDAGLLPTPWLEVLMTLVDCDRRALERLPRNEDELARWIDRHWKPPEVRDR